MMNVYLDRLFEVITSSDIISFLSCRGKKTWKQFLIIIINQYRSFVKLNQWN